jgi:hypothetical protein
MRTVVVVIMAALALASAPAGAQQRREASPEGMASTQVEGRWIDITYGRPILRGRTQIYGTGKDYAQKIYDGAPVWRAGANTSTRLKTDVALEIGGKPVPPGEYVMLIELKNEKDWTFILTKQSYVTDFNPQNTKDLYGAYNYRPDNDVTRAPMKVETIPFSVDQLTWGFTDVTPKGGTMRISWDRVMASVPFAIKP